MAKGERSKVLSDLQSELEELSALVAELVALATEQRADDEPITEIDLAALTEAVAERARRRTGRTVNVSASQTVIAGRPLGLERALTNLVDNAAKWGPPDEPIEVTVDSDDNVTRVTVRDHGPGIAAADRPLVFDRFYRATAARSMPGSGLGLSIVKQVVTSHGGRVFAEAPSDGGPGAVVGFELPPNGRLLSADS
jgi:two-component system sensor histidine kinase MprB